MQCGAYGENSVLWEKMELSVYSSLIYINVQIKTIKVQNLINEEYSYLKDMELKDQECKQKLLEKLLSKILKKECQPVIPSQEPAILN